MSLIEFAQYAFIAFLYLILFAFVFSAFLAVMSLWVFRKNTEHSTALAKKMLEDLDEDFGMTDFDRHVATTPGIIDNTND